MMRITSRRGLVAAMTVVLCCVAWLTMPQGMDFVHALPPGVALYSGDIVLLGSSTWRGRLLKILDRNSDYVHTGIIDNVDGVSYFVHADPCRGTVVCDPLEAYLLSNRVERVKIMRVGTGEQEAMKALAYAREQVRKSCRFNNTFRYGDGEGLYCTELVLRAWQSAGVLLLPNVQKGDRIFPSRLLESVRLKCVFECFGNDFVAEQKQQS